MEVQKYLRSGKTLKDLKSELGIIFSEYENLVILNYSQIDSPKFHPITMECRGLILEKDTWDIVSFPFRRFFNENEGNLPFDYSSAKGLEKIDGSLISVFFYKNSWLMSTRGKIENPDKISFYDISFRDLFDTIVKQYPDFYKKLSVSFAYIFELVSPENRVVNIYKDRALYLLTMRTTYSWMELPPAEVNEWASKLGIKRPASVSFDSKDSLLNKAKELKALEEGFVAIIYERDMDGISWKRVKVKNPSYVAIHHLKNCMGKSLRSLIRLVMQNNQDEFLSYFPEFKSYIDEVSEKYYAFLKKVDDDEKKLDFKKDKKSFALQAKDMKESAYFFHRYNSKTDNYRNYCLELEKTKGLKYLERYFVDRLKLKDIEFNIE